MGRYFPHLHQFSSKAVATMWPPVVYDLDWDEDEEVTLPMGFASHTEFKLKCNEWKEKGFCPRCGDKGEWRAMALFCRNGHGKFAG